MVQACGLGPVVIHRQTGIIWGDAPVVLDFATVCLTAGSDFASLALNQVNVRQLEMEFCRGVARTLPARGLAVELRSSPAHREKPTNKHTHPTLMTRHYVKTRRN
jgi:hypothetical protein